MYVIFWQYNFFNRNGNCRMFELVNTSFKLFFPLLKVNVKKKKIIGVGVEFHRIDVSQNSRRRHIFINSLSYIFKF